MTIEEARIKLSIIKNSYSIRNYFCTDMTHQEKALIDYENLVIGLIKEKQELIDYLKDLIENRFTNSKVVWFDSEYARDFGELCSMAGAGDTRLALVPLSEIENILSKIEKR